MERKGALVGIKVLDLSRMLPGPYCSMVLADHGARVISIEDHRFLADGLFMNTVNRNKEHMSLNLKTPEGQKIFHQLATDADVVLEGFRPGVVKRLAVDYQTLRQINPRIIYCAISGYGQTGPYRNRVGHDVNYLSVAGVLDQIGPAYAAPVIPGVQLADIAGGGMNAVLGIMLALYTRMQSGEGQYIDISMTDGMVPFLAAVQNFEQLTGTMPLRSDALLSHRYACYNTYETADGRYLSIGALEVRFWKRLCELLGASEYIPLQYDEDHRQEMITFFRNAFRAKTLDEWKTALGDLDVCWAPVQTLPEVLNDPLFIEREMVVELPHANPMLGVPVKLSATPGAVSSPPPAFGAHTASILAELGYANTEIERFAEQGIIYLGSDTSDA